MRGRTWRELVVVAASGVGLAALVMATPLPVEAQAAQAAPVPWCEGAHHPQQGTNFAGCPAVAAPAAVPARPSLYRRLGGREGIALVVDAFVANVVADPRVNARFKDLPPPAVFKLKSNLSDQICEMAGGPCAYLGRDMRAVHTGMNITEAEWSATVENLVKALDARGVGAAEKAEVLAALAPMKKDIVGL
jgi:hemoglobin